MIDNQIKFGPPDYQYMEGLELPDYTWLVNQSMSIKDPVWGEVTIGSEERDAVFLSSLHSPLLQRTMAIEQLTLGPRYSTIPNTGNFSRFEHIWGQLAFARLMIDRTPELRDLPEREKLILEARTYISDVGQWSFSHLGDWVLQKFGGPEDAHDNHLESLVEASHMPRLLGRFGVTTAGIAFPDAQDWIERSSPLLCVDRLDYSVREAMRWLQGIANVDLIKGVENYSIVDGNLVANSKETAEELFRAYGIISSEHWGEPHQKYLLHMLSFMAKSAITTGTNMAVFMMDDVHPADQLLSVDPDFVSSFHRRHPASAFVQGERLLRDIARRRRSTFIDTRRHELKSYFQDPELMFTFPRHLEEYAEVEGDKGRLTDRKLEIIPVEAPEDVVDFGENDSSVDIFLPSQKERVIDPQFIDKNRNVVQLSDADPRYKSLIEQQRAVLRQNYVGRLYMPPTLAQELKSEMKEVEEKFEGAMNRPRLTDDERNELLRRAGGMAVSSRLVNIDVWWDD